MNTQRKGITILAAVGFPVFQAGAGFSETTGSDSHLSRHPQANQEKAPAVSGCFSQSSCGHTTGHGCATSETGT